MQRPDLEQIERIATAFRTAVLQLNKSTWPVCLQQFPTGACGDASLLLGTLLEERGQGQFEYICGIRSESISGHPAPSHAWLELGGLIVDVTADQFDEVSDSVIVSVNSGWHRSWIVESKAPANFRHYDPHTVASLQSVYDQIVRSMRG